MTIQLQSKREPAWLALLWLRTSGVVVVVVMVTLMMPLDAARGMVVVMVMVLMRYPRILAEHQRLDRDRNRKGRHTHPTQIDIVEIPQRDAVQRQDLGCDRAFLLEKRTDRLRDVAIENQEYGPGS